MFKITSSSGNARAGVLKTAHGKMHTPCFKAVATKAAVKYMPSFMLEKIGQEAIISNAFLLSLRPGLETIKQYGGIHKFMDFNGTIFTDCGGFQVLSLVNDHHLNTTPKGLMFRSPFDGTKVTLTPKNLVQIQHTINSDVAMALDHMPLYGCSKEEAKQSVDNTYAWMKECKNLHDELRESTNSKQLMFGIAQGSVYPELREKSTRQIDSLGFDGIAFGGLAVGEPRDQTLKMIELSIKNCSWEKPHYAMGVGNPVDVLNCISLGVDTFDSVFPTRNARHGHLFTRQGTINIKNSKFRNVHSPIDEKCNCETCKRYTIAYVHHLFRAKERVAEMLCTVHNLTFMQELMKDSRKAIEEDRFEEFKDKFIKDYDG